MVWCGKVGHRIGWYSIVWYGMVWYGMVWYGMVWYGMVWYGMVWYGMVWCGAVSHSIHGSRISTYGPDLTQCKREVSTR